VRCGEADEVHDGALFDAPGAAGWRSAGCGHVVARLDPVATAVRLGRTRCGVEWGVRN
jgi:hypothetical protein